MKIAEVIDDRQYSEQWIQGYYSVDCIYSKCYTMKRELYDDRVDMIKMMESIPMQIDKTISN